MKISLEWLSDFVDLPEGLDIVQLAHDLTMKTVEVEGYEDLRVALRNVVVGRLVALEPVGDAAKTRLAICDIGSDSPISVVSSRVSNLSIGARIVVALPGAQLVAPKSEELRVVSRVEIAGIVSNGLIATVADLGLQRLFPRARAEDALDISGLATPIGSPVSEALGLNDTVIEIDNKSLTNRPDLWGHYGIARELAAIYSCELRPVAASHHLEAMEGLVGELDVALCQRMTVVTFFANKADESPLWLRSRLARIGESSVNLCVDLANYVMFTIGQPTHVYDTSRLAFPLSVVPSTTPVELMLLNGDQHVIDPPIAIITDIKGPICIAGIMGSAATATSADTQEFVLEVATFRPDAIRKGSQRLGLRTESSARFEKGLDTQRADDAVNLFLDLLHKAAPGASVTGFQEVVLDATVSTELHLSLDFLNKRIGDVLDTVEVSGLLRSLGFGVTEIGDDVLQVSVPTWRSTGDISLSHDLVEEVARLRGYDSFPVTPLTVTLRPLSQQERRPLERTVREQLSSRGGMQEIVTYPWVSDRFLAAAGFDKGAALHFEGAPASDRDSLRPSLVPNMLDAVVVNLRYADSFRLFEVGTTFDPVLRPLEERFEPLPRQSRMVAGAFVGRDARALFLEGKSILEMLRRYCNVQEMNFSTTTEVPWADHSARLGVVAHGEHVGALALLTNRARRLAGIGVQVAIFTLDLDSLGTYPSRENRYQPISEFPEAEFDLSIVVRDPIRWEEVVECALRGSALVSRISFIDEFRGDLIPEGCKSVTLRVTLGSMQFTLTADKIAVARAQIIAVLGDTLDARLREQ